MLQVAFIRQQLDHVKSRLAVKRFDKTHLLDELIKLDDERKKFQFEKDELLGKVNSISREIGALMKSGNKDEAESKKQEVAAIREKLNDVAGLQQLEQQIH